MNQVIKLLGTPHPEDIRASGASEGAFRYIMNQPFRPSQLHTLHTLSTSTSHEAIHLLCQMLVFNPEKRISVSDALTHPYLEEGRLRYHTCMCSCCVSSNSGRQYAHGEYMYITQIFKWLSISKCNRNKFLDTRGKLSVHSTWPREFNVLPFDFLEVISYRDFVKYAILIREDSNIISTTAGVSQLLTNIFSKLIRGRD